MNFIDAKSADALCNVETDGLQAKVLTISESDRLEKVNPANNAL